MTFTLAVVLLLLPASCPGDAVKAKLLCLGFQKRIQTCKYSSVCGAIHGGLFPEPGRRVALLAGLHKGCFYKVGQFQLCKNSLTLRTHSKYVSASDDSNASFERCRVVLVVCPKQSWPNG